MKALVIEQGVEYIKCQTLQVNGDIHRLLLTPTSDMVEQVTKRIPLHQVFNLLLFKKDSLSNIKVGCDRYTDCKLISVTKGFLIDAKRDRFYNLSEHALYRADMVTDYLNEEGYE